MSTATTPTSKPAPGTGPGPCPAGGLSAEDFAERLVGAAAGATEIFTVYLGVKLGLYRALAANDPVTSGELALTTGTQERYVREWLEQQTVIGIVHVEDPEQGPFERRYSLPAGHAEALTDEDSLNFAAPLGQLLVASARPMPQLLDAYRHGGGVPYTAYGADMRQGIAAFNKPMFLRLLGQEWLPAMPDVAARLRDQERPARVADFGCGQGWSAIGVAREYPHAQVTGYDSDAASIEEARANAAQAGVAERVRFQRQDVSGAGVDERYDLVLCCEMLHDLADPAGALRAAREILDEGGSVLVIDERVGHRFTRGGEGLEWLMYGYSVLHCLPVGMADGAEHHCGGTGAVMRPDTLARYAAEAGFGEVEELDLDCPFFRFYRLRKEGGAS